MSDDEVLYIEDLYQGSIYAAEPDPYNPTLPQPYVESLSPTGLLTIGWSQLMVPYSDYFEIESSQVAVRPQKDSKAIGN